MRALLRTFAPFAVALALIAAAFAFVTYSAALPASLAGVKVYGPYIVFALAAALAAAFNRGRALFALLALVMAYGAQQAWLQQGLNAPAARAVYAGLTVFVPAFLALLALLPERGTLNRHGAVRLAILGALAAFTAWVAVSGQSEITGWAYRKFLDPSPLTAGRIPQLGIAVIAASVLVTMAAALITRSAVSTGLAGAIIAFAIAAHVPTASVTFAIFTMAAQLMVAIAVLQDTFRMAFRDELTGIPSRRALNEQLAALPNRYTIAMLDVDHFKKFNDTYGHDLGDQVLKMVGAHIARVGGGGKAFRYGGEEFTVLFPGRDAEDAIPCLEAVREDIEAYRMALRGSNRPPRTRRAKRQRGGWRGRKGVAVTVSIGVAERNGRFDTPQEVIEAADRALYRAKEKGRNRLSR
ncbi:MAG TPA: GGDEF domain-containing protein [Burkholderiales bacterium]|jgi:diguanylate cyclase (GGDEF)-like protein